MSLEDPQKMPSIPLQQVIEASQDLPAPFRIAITLLCTKIDKGFSSILFFMRRVIELDRQREDDHAELVERIEELEDQVKTLVAAARSEVSEPETSSLVAEVAEMRDREITTSTKLAEVHAQLKAGEFADAAVEKYKAEQAEKAEKRSKGIAVLWKTFWAGMGAAILYALSLLAKVLGLSS